MMLQLGTQEPRKTDTCTRACLLLARPVDALETQPATPACMLGLHACAVAAAPAVTTGLFVAVELAHGESACNWLQSHVALVFTHRFIIASGRAKQQQARVLHSGAGCTHAHSVHTAQRND